ncbi:MAG: phage tail protein [Pirellulales bacterium]
MPTPILFATKGNAEGQLASGINASVTSIPLGSGEGAEFPQPYRGTASSTGSGTVLNDTGDLGSVGQYKVIRNVTDGSWAIVLTTGTDSITTTRLRGGSDNTWESGDEWRVDEFIAFFEKVVSEVVTKREKALIVGRSTDTLTVATGGRGYDGSTAQSFDAGDYVRLHVASKSIEEMIKAIADLDIAENTLNATLTALIADLAATSNGDGAALVGIEDAGAYFTGDTVEEALQELGAVVSGPTGSLMMWTTNTAPTGWFLCYGQAVSRTTYSALFAVVGTTFGSGDGSTTFNLPDFRGRMPLGKDNMGGSSANRVTDTEADNLGQAAGAEEVTLTDAQVPAQSVLVQTAASGGGPSVARIVDAGGDTVLGVATNTNDTASYSTEGGGGAHENMPPYLTVNYIIKF